MSSQDYSVFVLMWCLVHFMSNWDMWWTFSIVLDQNFFFWHCKYTMHLNVYINNSPVITWLNPQSSGSIVKNFFILANVNMIQYFLTCLNPKSSKSTVQNCFLLASLGTREDGWGQTVKDQEACFTGGSGSDFDSHHQRQHPSKP